MSYIHGKVVNIVYELGAYSSHNNDPTLKNCLSGAVTLNKNADNDKYGPSGHGIGFDRRSSFSFPGGGFGQNVIIFGVDMSSFGHIDNMEKDILILGKRPANSYLFANGTEIDKIKAKDSEIVATPLCLGNISEDWSTDYMKKQGLMDMPMILVLIMMLLMLMILLISANI